MTVVLVLAGQVDVIDPGAYRIASSRPLKGGTNMKPISMVMALIAGAWLLACQVAPAVAAPCLVVTLTGTQSGPPSFNGLAGAGTLVRYGDDANDCGAVKLQFDAGRGTIMRLSQLGITPEQLTAVFFTHLHSDHVMGFPDIMQVRWMFDSKGPRVDVVCSSDAISPLGTTRSCRTFVKHVGDTFVAAGEIAERHAENKSRLPGGPAELANVITFDPNDEPRTVWSGGDVKVSAVRSAHVAGHASYRVDTPAGSVVIGGDARNDSATPPRATSTSAQVERLSKGADIIVHSTMHPIMGPGTGSTMPGHTFFGQSATADLGAMANRAGAKHLMLTHLAPPIGADRIGPWKVPGGVLTEADFRKAVLAGGFTGNIVVGSDLASLRLPMK